jgi:hypothetical protein
MGSFGRYTIERELARGGMGVIYLAFDPELERRVALKVLSVEDEGGRLRLLREARAMARLAHPNVATVFDVGAIDGHDFVAMELMEGGTLADWLRAKPRSQRDIIVAFLAAGRGLGAAHAAGLVHRDFKPSNVLRTRDGRFAVTDFGLARDHGDDSQRQKVRSDVHVVPRPPSALDDLTVTGWILGTPQYMAPEQWDNHAVTPATDQFSFCVSLFEGFAGKTPYHGRSGETLRQAVTDGPGNLDMTKLPRRLRWIVARGLDPDPAKRWPDMDRLLAALERIERLPRIVARSIGGLAATIAVAVMVAMWTSVPAPPPPSIVVAPCNGIVARTDPAIAWSSARQAGVSPRLRNRIAAIVTSWQRLRASTCRTAAEQTRQLDCLDGVMARVDLVTDLAAHVPDGLALDYLGYWLITPEVCNQADPPRLLTEFSPRSRELVEAIVTQGRVGPAHERTCERAIHLWLDALQAKGPAADRLYDDAATGASGCDERLFADIMLLHLDEVTSPDARKELAARVRAAAERVPDPRFEASLLVENAWRAFDEERYDDALAIFAAAKRGLDPNDGFAAELTLAEMRTRFTRHTAQDMAIVARELPAISDGAMTGDRQVELAVLRGRVDWERGDLVAAHDVMDPATTALPPVETGLPVTHGRVLDAAGKPVAGAIVLAQDSLDLDAIGSLPFVSLGIALATTDARGEYTIADGWGWVRIAVRDGQRSLPSHDNGAPLVLGTTRRISGRVVGWSGPAPPVIAAFVPGAQDVRFVAPVSADGRFALDGVPDVPVELCVIARFHASANDLISVIGRGAVTGLEIHAAPMDRKLHVSIVPGSNAFPDQAYVWVLPRTHEPKTIDEAWSLPRYAEAEGVVEDDRLDILLHDVPRVPALVCAVGHYPKGRPDGPWFNDPKLRVSCKPIAADDTEVSVPVAPTAR